MPVKELLCEEEKRQLHQSSVSAWLSDLREEKGVSVPEWISMPYAHEADLTLHAKMSVSELKERASLPMTEKAISFRPFPILCGRRNRRACFKTDRRSQRAGFKTECGIGGNELAAKANRRLRPRWEPYSGVPPITGRWSFLPSIRSGNGPILNGNWNGSGKRS